MNTSPAQAPGSTPFGKYRILERVAVGGMAEIYKARLDGIGGFHRTFAIKRILPHLTSRQEFVDMLVDEAKIAGLLSHANIVQIMDLGQVSGTYYIAMEFVDGPDLGRLLRRCRERGLTMPVSHAVFIAIEMLKALEYAHNRQVMRGGRLVPLNIVHRDISPANVLVSHQGEVKLTDFGIAKASVKALETISGVIKGRFNYLSPEQAAGQNADQRSDLFATGVVLYEMLTGRHPYAKPNEAETLDAIRESRYPRPSAVQPQIPAGVEMIVEQALRADPSQRYPSATLMKEALERYMHESGDIFTTQQLASWMRQIYQQDQRPEPNLSGATTEARPLPQRLAEPRPPEARPPARPQEEAEDRPTQAESTLVAPVASADTTIRRKPLLGQQAVDLARAATLPREQMTAPSPVVLPHTADESTVIKPNPALLKQTAAPAEEPGWTAQAETLIRQDPSRKVAPATENIRPEAGVLHRAPPPRRPTTGPIPPPPLTSEPAPETLPATPSQVGIPARSVRRFQLMYLVFGAVVTVLVLVVGVLIGVQVNRIAAPPPEVAGATVVPATELEVRAPGGARVFVDQREMAGASSGQRLNIASGNHKIRVELAEHEPVETTVTLAPGELRLVVVQSEQMTRRKK